MFGYDGYSPRMPFGKHKGERICDLPSGYILWCLKNLRDLGYVLRSAMEAEIRSRDAAASSERWREPPRPEPPPRPQPSSASGAVISKADVEQRLKAWFRRLALKYHPDRGGSKEQMQALLDAKDQLASDLGITF